MKRLLIAVALAILLLEDIPASGPEPFFSSGFEELPGYAIHFCRLQFPQALSAPGGATVDVLGRLYISGLTNFTEVNNPSPYVIGYVGYGPDGTQPTSGWTWITAVPNPAYGVLSPGFESDNDEYMAQLTVPDAAGPYDFAFRFSGNGGITFTYCDLESGSSDGYSPANAGQMTSLGT